MAKNGPTWPNKTVGVREPRSARRAYEAKRRARRARCFALPRRGIYHISEAAQRLWRSHISMKQSAERTARGALRSPGEANTNSLTPEGADTSPAGWPTRRPLYIYIYIYIYLTVDLVGHPANVVFAPSGERKAPSPQLRGFACVNNRCS